MDTRKVKKTASKEKPIRATRSTRAAELTNENSNNNGETVNLTTFEMSDAYEPNNDMDNDTYNNFLSDIAHTLQSIDTTSTERILEEAEILLAEFRNGESDRSNIIDAILEGEPSNVNYATTSAHTSQSSTQNLQGTSSFANSTITDLNGPIDDSVVIINDENSLPCNRLTDVDDEVIFVDEQRGTKPQRIISVVDLCSPESHVPRKRKRATKDVPIAIVENPPLPQAPLDKSVTAPVKVNCPVCMETIKNEAPFSTICGHLFCGSCIKRAIKTRKKCPMCNTNLNAKQIHPIYLGV